MASNASSAAITAIIEPNPEVSSYPFYAAFGIMGCLLLTFVLCVQERHCKQKEPRSKIAPAKVELPPPPGPNQPPKPPATKDVAASSAAKPPTRMDRLMRRKVEARAEDALHGEAPAALADAVAEDEELAKKLAETEAARAVKASLAAEKAALDRREAKEARLAEAKRLKAAQEAQEDRGRQEAQEEEKAKAALEAARELHVAKEMAEAKLEEAKRQLAEKGTERGVDELHEEELQAERAKLREEAEKAESAAEAAAKREAAATAAAEEAAAAKAAAEKRLAEEEEAARLAAEEAARNNAEYTLQIFDIRAFDVPSADENSLSDCYVHFELCELPEGEVETGQTMVVYDSENPVWDDRVQITLPAGSPAALDKSALLRISVFDQDLTNGDDQVSGSEHRIDVGEGTSGGVDKLMLEGKHRSVLLGGGFFKSHEISFQWQLLPFVPPPATLRLTNVHAKGLPTQGLSRFRKNKAKKANARPDPYLRFSLLEVGDLVQEARTPPMPGVKDAKWDGETLILELPKGSPRPPLLQVRDTQGSSAGRAATRSTFCLSATLGPA